MKLNTNLSSLEAYRCLRIHFLNTVLLESMGPPDDQARQSVICFDPVVLVRIDSGRLYINGQSVAEGLDEIMCELRRLLHTYSAATSPGFPGGLLGFSSYDLVRYVEHIPDAHIVEFPDALYALYLDGVVYDHVHDEVVYFHSPDFESRGDQVEKLLAGGGEEVPDFRVEDIDFLVSKKKYMEDVEKIQELVKAGEVFQVVLSQRAEFRISGDRFALYERLRDINPSPYMYCFEFHDLAIIGSSPELLISKEFEVLSTFPIAGTRPRGKDDAETEAFMADLSADEKELAEHNMLVDLARNDLGKVSKVGSVSVSRYKEVEIFSHVMHIVSRVDAEIDDQYDQFDAFLAVFPAGTVSGAPKIRAMEIIDSMEGRRRGPYAGSVGYFGLDGSMVQAIAIRTAFGRGDNFHIQAGGGVVMDSDPLAEYQETLNKLGALLQTLEVSL